MKTKGGINSIQIINFPPSYVTQFSLSVCQSVSQFVCLSVCLPDFLLVFLLVNQLVSQSVSQFALSVCMCVW